MIVLGKKITHNLSWFFYSDFSEMYLSYFKLFNHKELNLFLNTESVEKFLNFKGSPK